MKIDHVEIKKRLSVFALSLVIIHRIISFYAKGTAIGSRTCVETEDNTYFCTDDIQEAREKAKKTHRYYLNNFGETQTIVGNTKDVEKMRKLEADMEAYLKKFIEDTKREEWTKEQCTNNHKNCVFWASKGECMGNPTYMEPNCALACQSCHKLKKPTQNKSEESCSCSADQEMCGAE